MSKIDVLDINGQVVESIDLASDVFNIEPNKQALYDAIIMQRASLRQGTHKTKGRSEVRGGGRKPWRQKGTGRARQGTIRAPQWKGGGVVFGPTPRSYAYKLNKKVRRLALLSAISEKFIKGEMVVIQDLVMDAPKTKAMISLFSNVNANRKPLLITAEYDENVFLSTRNITGALNLDVEGLNVLDLVSAHKVIYTKSACEKMAEVYSK